MEAKRQRAYMVTFILSPPSAKKCLSLAKEQGVENIFVLRGKGTVNNQTLQLLGIKRQDKVVLNMMLDAKKARTFLNRTSEELALHKPNHGIAFLTPIERMVYGEEEMSANSMMDILPEEEDMQYKKLTVVVNLGMAEEIMTVAREAGARGGTILHGRGTGAQVPEKLFGIEIEPEKELLLILATEDVMNSVIAALEDAFDFTRPGTGILFVESISDVRGLVSK